MIITEIRVQKETISSMEMLNLRTRASRSSLRIGSTYLVSMIGASRSMMRAGTQSHRNQWQSMLLIVLHPFSERVKLMLLTASVELAAI
jgi:hypothetical protein